MATIQFKRRTTAGTGPLIGTSGLIRAGEPQVDFNGGNLYIAKTDKTASGANPISINDYMEIPSTNAVDNRIDNKISNLGLGNASTRNVGTGSGNIPVLDSGGKLADSMIPKIAITNTFVVSSQSAMLSLSSAQEGDVAVRTDVSKTFILTSGSYNNLSSWQEMITPTDSVTSVNGKTGAVNISLSELGGVASTTFNSHASSSAHLTSEQITKLSNVANTIININGAASYEGTLANFTSKIIYNGLILHSVLDTNYTPYKRVYSYGIDKNAVLTPTSVIDGGTY